MQTLPNTRQFPISDNYNSPSKTSLRTPNNPLPASSSSVAVVPFGSRREYGDYEKRAGLYSRMKRLKRSEPRSEMEVGAWAYKYNMARLFTVLALALLCCIATSWDISTDDNSWLKSTDDAPYFANV